MLCVLTFCLSLKKSTQAHVRTHKIHTRNPVFSQDEKVVLLETSWHPTQSLCMCVCMRAGKTQV